MLEARKERGILSNPEKARLVLAESVLGKHEGE